MIPDCQGDARFNSHDQAMYVAVDLTESEGGKWEVVAHGDHWHVRETA